MRKPSAAVVIAFVALFSSLAGGAVAARLITGKQVKDGSLTGRDIKNRSVAKKDLARDALPRTGAKGDKGDTGLNGAPGKDGLQGPAGPSGPAVQVRLSGAASIPSNGSAHFLSWGVENFDPQNMHDNEPTVANRLTAVKSGVYQVSASVCWSSNAAGVRRLSLVVIPAEGPSRRPATDQGDASTGGFTCQNVSQLIKLAAGEHVRVEVFQNSGSPLTINSDTLSNDAVASLAWVGDGT